MDLAEPAVDAGLLDAVAEVSDDLFQSLPLLRVDAEHRTPDACIRCPMLQVNSKMLPRLAEIERDLILRRRRAEEEQWLVEMEGIDMTLTFVRTKQADAARLAQRSPVALGIPTTRPSASDWSTTGERQR